MRCRHCTRAYIAIRHGENGENMTLSVLINHQNWNFKKIYHFQYFFFYFLLTFYLKVKLTFSPNTDYKDEINSTTCIDDR
jgi:hypothetical protein